MNQKEDQSSQLKLCLWWISQLWQIIIQNSSAINENEVRLDDEKNEKSGSIKINVKGICQFPFKFFIEASRHDSNIVSINVLRSIYSWVKNSYASSIIDTIHQSYKMQIMGPNDNQNEEELLKVSRIYRFDVSKVNNCNEKLNNIWYSFKFKRINNR